MQTHMDAQICYTNTGIARTVTHSHPHIHHTLFSGSISLRLITQNRVVGLFF